MNDVLPQLILASGSAYRRVLLGRLGLPFDVVVPDIDEAPAAGETPQRTALRLASAKATKVAQHASNALVIGSDQVATIDGLELGKPGTHERALEQLRRMRGREIDFHTALCLYDARDGSSQSRLVSTRVRFRAYSEQEIEAYLRAEQPYDCAGSAKSEGLGIALIESIEGSDPNALIGLPLIELVTMLGAVGVHVLIHARAGSAGFVGSSP